MFINSQLHAMLIFLIIILCHFQSSFSSPISATVAQPLVPALYVFGDSLFDNGNNNLLPTLARANFPPYGVSFPSGATGRFTDGRTVADFIAEYLGLPYPPPYISLRGKSSVTGYNYASGSCGILPETGSHLGLCLNLGAQIKLFETTVKMQLPPKFKNKMELTRHLSKSIFIFSVGNNDYINNYFDSSFSHSRRRYDAFQFAHLLINTFSLHLHRLYKLGARKIVVFELGPIGCIPSITKQQGKHVNGTCDETKNDIVSIFNDELASTLKNLTASLPGSMFVLGHANWLGYDAVIHPFKYGLSNSNDPCCITWGNGTLSCIPELLPCSSPNHHYFWDAYHLTEATYADIASQCINGSSVCVPLNIKDLVNF